MNKIVEQLRKQIRCTETASRIEAGDVVTHDCPAIDQLLPQHGYSRGTLVQWLSAGGQAADFLSLRVAHQACQNGGALVVVDPLQQFFPPAAAALGINLDNLIVLRTGQLNFPREVEAPAETRHQDDLLWAIDQSLRCSAVAAVWGPVGEIDDRWFRRFQLSAESSGCLGLFRQPLSAARLPSWAEVQWTLSSTFSESRTRPKERVENIKMKKSATCELTRDRLPGIDPALNPEEAAATLQSVRLQLTRCRGTHSGKTIQVSINHVTGKVERSRKIERTGISRTGRESRVGNHAFTSVRKRAV
jgi:protein ImuA